MTPGSSWSPSPEKPIDGWVWSHDLSIKWGDGRDRRTGGSTVALGACPGHRGHQSNHRVADAAGRRLSDTRFGVSGAGLLVGKRAYGLEGHSERGQALGAAFKAPAARDAASVAEASGRLPSLVLWGPPGCGKTTIARLLAHETKLEFEQLSAIFSGVADLRKAFDRAKARREQGRGTLLFIDEIHRFNRSQQDSFLPYMEDGTITLVGATTENPSFEINAAVLSRASVLTLNRLDDAALLGRAPRWLADPYLRLAGDGVALVHNLATPRQARLSALWARLDAGWTRWAGIGLGDLERAWSVRRSANATDVLEKEPDDLLFHKLIDGGFRAHFIIFVDHDRIVPVKTDLVFLATI